MQNDKVSNHISKIRQTCTEYRAVLTKMDGLVNEWNALYGTLVDEDSFVGENESVIPTGDPSTKTASMSTVIANFGTILTTYEQGINTNFEKVTL